MLEFFRKNIGGLLGFVVIGLLVAAFSLTFGAQGEGWGKGQETFVPATVNGEDISETSYRIALNMSGGRMVAGDPGEYAALQRAVINGLIERQLLLQIAEEAGITASESEVEDRIIRNEFRVSRSIEDLVQQLTGSFYGFEPVRASRVLLEDGYAHRERFETKDGKFDVKVYKNWVQYTLQATDHNFIEEQRRELIAQRVRESIVAGVRVSEGEVRAAYDRENDTASIAYLRLYPEYFADQLSPTAEEIAAYAQEQQEAIRQYYETNKYKYTNLEKQARARHILVKVPEGATDADKAAKRLLIDGLLARARGGEDFAALARQHSEDPGSAAQGGDLGYNPRGRMVPEFDEAMFALAPGKISDVVTTQFGFHVIKLEGFREGNVPLEEATPEIAEQLYREGEGRRRAELAAGEYLARLKAGEPIESLVPPPADGGDTPEGGLQVRTTPEFGRGTATVPTIGSAPEIAEAAFALTADAPVPDKVFQVREDFFVVALKERKTPSDADFAKQKDAIGQRLLAVKQASWLRAYVRELRDRAERDGRITSELLAAGAAEGEGAAEDLGARQEQGAAPADEGRKGEDEGGEDKGGESKAAEPPREEPEAD